MKQFLVSLSLLFVFQNSIAQKIGIGTNTPHEKLHVAGNIKADTIKPAVLLLTENAGAGKVLTSDASGHANWQQKTTGNSANGGVGFGTWGDCSMNGVSEYNPVADPDAATGDNAGHSVAISGNLAVVGAEGDDCCGDLDRGSVSFYRFDGTKWVFMQKLVDADGGADDHFGLSVAISGNYALVGAYRDDCCGGVDQGSVSIYQFNGSNWVFMQKITDPDGNNGDAFGCSVSLSGNLALIGSYGDNGPAGNDQGSALVFQLVNGTWVFMQKIMDGDGSAGDSFGYSVSISGNSLIVGSFGDDHTSGYDQGSASFYQFNGTHWILKLKATNPSIKSFENFGYSVSISGNYALIGIPGKEIPISAPTIGACDIYRYDGSNWTWINRTVEQGAQNYGYSVAISGDYVIVGEKNHQSNAGTTGAAYAYVRLALGLQKIQFIKDPAGRHGDNFGHSTAIDGQNLRFLIGAYGYQGSGKAVFGKIN